MSDGTSITQKKKKKKKLSLIICNDTIQILSHSLLERY